MRDGLHPGEGGADAWDDYGTAVPVHVLTHEGVPIVPVYANPERRR